MRILISSTYFHPYSSGLSVYAQRLAEGLGELGHEVVVLTSQFKSDLDLLEEKENSGSCVYRSWLEFPRES